jgi:hypothetical protein
MNKTLAENPKGTITDLDTMAVAMGKSVGEL